MKLDINNITRLFECPRCARQVLDTDMVRVNIDETDGASKISNMYFEPYRIGFGMPYAMVCKSCIDEYNEHINNIRIQNRVNEYAEFTGVSKMEAYREIMGQPKFRIGGGMCV